MYQFILSRRWYGCCRFTPSCSQYTIDAVERFGAFKGLYLSLRRLLKCHPFCQLWGSDPVPESFPDNPLPPKKRTILR